MTDKDPSSQDPSTNPVSPPQWGEQALQFWLKEYEVLKELYTQAENSAQSIFNFYLSLITTVVGAIVLIVQFAPPDVANPNRLLWIVGGILLFVAGIGSTYLSSISGRYAHLARYAQAIDEIRRFLIERLNTPLPPMYQSFIAPRVQPPARLIQRLADRLVWVFPIGTFQFFIVALNSTALAAAAWIFLRLVRLVPSSVRGTSLIVAGVFLAMNAVYNVYSRLVLRAVTSRLDVRVDVQHDLPYVSGKQ